MRPIEYDAISLYEGLAGGGIFRAYPILVGSLRSLCVSVQKYMFSQIDRQPGFHRNRDYAHPARPTKYSHDDAYNRNP